MKIDADETELLESVARRVEVRRRARARAGSLRSIRQGDVPHYDVAAKRDVAGRTVIGAQWRYTEWDGGAAGREFYWRPDDPGEYHNRVADAALKAPRTNAETLLGTVPQPKPGPANRPRALEAPETKRK